jgi:hypothetical protein
LNTELETAKKQRIVIKAKIVPVKGTIFAKSSINQKLLLLREYRKIKLTHSKHAAYMLPAHKL